MMIYREQTPDALFVGFMPSPARIERPRSKRIFYSNPQLNIALGAADSSGYLLVGEPLSMQFLDFTVVNVFHQHGPTIDLNFTDLSSQSAL